MSSINWDEIEGKYGNRSLNSGTYTTKVTKVELKDATPSGSYPIDFELAPVKEGKLKSITEWLSFKEGKDGWRQHRMKEVMVALGCTEEWAKSAVEKAEDAGDKQKIADAYEQALSKAITKNKDMEVECWSETYTKKDGTQGTGARTGWLDPRLYMKHDNAPAPQANDVFAGSDDDIDLESIPF